RLGDGGWIEGHAHGESIVDAVAGDVDQRPEAWTEREALLDHRATDVPYTADARKSGGDEVDGVGLGSHGGGEEPRRQPADRRREQLGDTECRLVTGPGSCVRQQPTQRAP